MILGKHYTYFYNNDLKSQVSPLSYRQKYKQALRTELTFSAQFNQIPSRKLSFDVTNNSTILFELFRKRRSFRMRKTNVFTLSLVYVSIQNIFHWWTVKIDPPYWKSNKCKATNNGQKTIKAREFCLLYSVRDVLRVFRRWLLQLTVAPRFYPPFLTFFSAFRIPLSTHRHYRGTGICVHEWRHSSYIAYNIILLNHY